MVIRICRINNRRVEVSWETDKEQMFLRDMADKIHEKNNEVRK